jgi:hypothetical protein
MTGESQTLAYSVGSESESLHPVNVHPELPRPRLKTYRAFGGGCRSRRPAKVSPARAWDGLGYGS